MPIPQGSTPVVVENERHQFNDGLYAKGLLTLSSVTGLVAHAGGGQSLATPLTAQINNVTTTATNADSALLPVVTSDGSQLIVVKNSGAATLAVFPPSGGTINGGSANASVNVATTASQIFVAITATNWITLI